ncbi:MAG: hypothetical protein IPN07_16490 [Dehalococcoidia bacterium]|nr:hypothetical protein [Dehalococcoidia bacterium]
MEGLAGNEQAGEVGVVDLARSVIFGRFLAAEKLVLPRTAPPIEFARSIIEEAFTPRQVRLGRYEGADAGEFDERFEERGRHRCRH